MTYIVPGGALNSTHNSLARSFIVSRTYMYDS